MLSGQDAIVGKQTTGMIPVTHTCDIYMVQELGIELCNAVQSRSGLQRNELLRIFFSS